MLTSYRVENNTCTSILWKEGEPFDAKSVWFDLCYPTLQETLSLQEFLKISFPSLEERHEIEQSSRIYEEDDAFYMTATLVLKVETDKPEITDVTFILKGNQLVTLRDSESKAFNKFTNYLLKNPKANDNAQVVFVGLLEAIVDRSADILESIELELDKVSRTLFRRAPSRRREKIVEDEFSMKCLIIEIGQSGHLNSSMTQSLLNLDLVTSYTQKMKQQDGTDIPAVLMTRLQTLSHDIKSLTNYSSSLTAKVNFLLDATLGLINIEQNTVVKIFSIIAVIFTPPMLIASIYGMNLRMPETEWTFGYPISIILMVCSTILCYSVFKAKRWL